MAREFTRNAGSVALGKVGRSQAQIVREVGCKRPALCHWLSGRWRPSVDWRVKLRDKYAIPLELWDQAVDAPRDALLSVLATSPAQGAEAAPVTPAVVRGQAEQLLVQINGLAESVRTDPMMTPSEKARTLASCSTQLKTLGDLTGATRDISETRILRSPAWQRIQDAMLQALRPWPDAMRAVGEALLQLEGAG